MCRLVESRKESDGVSDAATASGTCNPLHAAFYADRAAQLRVRVVENVQLARDTYRVRFECPEIARRIVPGQFLMLRLAGLNDPLLGRPLALYDTVLDGRRRLDCDRRRLSDARQDDAPLGPVGAAARARRVGTARQRLSADRHRAPDHGRRRHRPDAVSGPRPGVSRDRGKYGDPRAIHAACQARDALLRRAHRRLAGRRAGLSRGRHRRPPQQRRRHRRPSRPRDRPAWAECSTRHAARIGSSSAAARSR